MQYDKEYSTRKKLYQRMKEETYSKQLAKLNRTEVKAESSTLDKSLDSTKPRTFRKAVFDDSLKEKWGRPTISENS